MPSTEEYRGYTIEKCADGTFDVWYQQELVFSSFTEVSAKVYVDFAIAGIIPITQS